MTKKNGKKRGRPFLNINWNKVEFFAFAGAKGRAIAEQLGIGYSTLTRRFERDVKKYDKTLKKWNYENFDAYLRSKRKVGDMMLQVEQFKSAIEDKNIPMQIFLGKNRLGQSDKKDVNHKNNGGSFKGFDILPGSDKDKED